MCYNGGYSDKCIFLWCCRCVDRWGRALIGSIDKLRKLEKGQKLIADWFIGGGLGSVSAISGQISSIESKSQEVSALNPLSVAGAYIAGGAASVGLGTSRVSKVVGRSAGFAGVALLGSFIGGLGENGLGGIAKGLSPSGNGNSCGCKLN